MKKRSEQSIMNEVQTELAADGVMLFRNNTGALLTADGRFVKFGLAVGSSDLIGVTPIKITPDMIGKSVAVFTAIEIKNKNGRPTKSQLGFIQRVLELGGIAGIARSVDDARKIIRGFYE